MKKSQYISVKICHLARCYQSEMKTRKLIIYLNYREGYVLDEEKPSILIKQEHHQKVTSTCDIKSPNITIIANLCSNSIPIQPIRTSTPPPRTNC